MYEGKPMVLVVGSTDTGRTPIVAALLRRALGSDVVVRTAGVLAHAGEPAAQEAQMALEQLNIDIGRHISRALTHDEHSKAELLLAVDRGTELVLFTEFPNDPRVDCLSIMADQPDVLDPHRMPLGIWVTTVRQLHDQVDHALPRIRERLGIRDQEPLPPPKRTVERRKSGAATPLVLGTNRKTEWASDEDMQRLMSLISSGEASSAEATDMTHGDAQQHEPEAASNTEAANGQQQDKIEDEMLRFDPVTAPESTTASPQEEATHDVSSATPLPAIAPREEHVARMLRMLEVAEEMPEIVDWTRLRHHLVARMRAVAQQSNGTLDFTPAAVLMIEGKLAQQGTQPSTDGIYMLRRSIKRLTSSVSGADLAAIGSEIAEW